MSEYYSDHKYYVIIRESPIIGYYYSLFDVYRGTYINGDYVSREVVNESSVLYKIEIDINLFCILKKGKTRFNDINSFIIQYGLEEKII
jgi:hypothetical protein